MLCVDEKRRTLWVTENVGARLWQIDLATGRVKQTMPGLKASAVAVDPATGNAWVVIPEFPVEKSRIAVVSPKGNITAEHAVAGFDIAHSSHDNSFWILDRNVYNMNREGQVVG